jgi:hypothetical protein
MSSPLEAQVCFAFSWDWSAESLPNALKEFDRSVSIRCQESAVCITGILISQDVYILAARLAGMGSYGFGGLRL